MRLLGALALLPVLIISADAASVSEVVIGVISPTGGGRAIGVAHEATIRFAFEQHGRTLQVDNLAFPLRIEYRDDRGEPERAARLAHELVEDGAIAILGPVSSSGVAAVLAAGLKVPVLGALATAPALTEPRDPWFFRLTLSDSERMWRFARALFRDGEAMPGEKLVLFDDGDPYGEGLRSALMGELGVDPDTAVAWSQLAPEHHPVENRAVVSAGEGFSQAFHTRLASSPGTIFFLGPSAGGVPIATGIQAVLRSTGRPLPRFYFVGADSDLRTGAPEGSYTIGGPTIDAASSSRAAATLDDFVHRSGLDADGFLVTAYEAAHYVLPAAIAGALRVAGAARPTPARGDAARIVTPARLAELVRRQLESHTFESLEPWRRISLHGGRMEGAPDVPLLRIERRFQVAAVPAPRPWLEIEAPPEIGLLEGPVHLRVKGHHLPSTAEISIVRADSQPYETIASLTPSSSGDGWAEASFYPRWPGTYRVLTKSVPTSPGQPTISVQPGLGYLAALLGAVLGSLLFIFSFADRGGRVSRSRVALGLITGLVLAFASLNRGVLPQGLPLPSFGGSPTLDALWTGFAGGWFGPSILLLLVPRLMPGLDVGAPVGSEGSRGAGT